MSELGTPNKYAPQPIQNPHFQSRETGGTSPERI